MQFVCTGSTLMFQHVTLTYGQVIELPEPEGEALVLAGRPLVPVDHVDFEFDGSPESIHKLARAHAGYKQLLESEQEKEK